MISAPVTIYFQLAVHIENSIKEFYFMKGISREEISKEDYCKALSEVAISLGLKVKIEEESAITPPETSLEIINETIDTKGDLLCEMGIM